jgi:hypothetical protein
VWENDIKTDIAYVEWNDVYWIIIVYLRMRTGGRLVWISY